MFKRVSQCLPAVSICILVPSTHSITFPYHLPPNPPFFKGFQYLSLYPLPSHVFCFTILLMLYHSLFFSYFLKVPYTSSIIKNMFYIQVCIWSCLVLGVCLSFASIFHPPEKTWLICLFEPGLLHYTWCPPVASTYLQTTCHYFLWLSKTPFYIYI
jgi:hypothetical protein